MSMSKLILRTAQLRSSVDSRLLRRFLLTGSALILAGGYILVKQDLMTDLRNHTLLQLKDLNTLKAQSVESQKEESRPDIKRSIIITPRQKLFFQFASVEYEGQPYMTPRDFLESVTEDHPRPRMKRRILSKEKYKEFLRNTPSRRYGSNKLFRSLEDQGIISYSEYLFLLCVITRPKSNFQIAFNMFDQDGNQRVDKNEFLLMTRIFQRESEPKKSEEKSSMFKSRLKSLIVKEEEQEDLTKSELDPVTHIDTSLLVHFFGVKGNDVLKFEDFKKFMEDLQREVLEIEFNEFSKGMNKISSVEFAEILLRYTNFEQAKKIRLLKKLHSKMDVFTREICFDKFLDFSKFMMNLEDFQLALQFHMQANRSISEKEFQRAVKISSGFELDPKIVEVIYKVFDEDGDGNLSYKEFIAVLKDRLKRGLQTKSHHIYEMSCVYANDDLFSNANSNSQSDVITINEEKPSWMKDFKKCVRRKLRERTYD